MIYIISIYKKLFICFIIIRHCHDLRNMIHLHKSIFFKQTKKHVIRIEGSWYLYGHFFKNS